MTAPIVLGRTAPAAPPMEPIVATGRTNASLYQQPAAWINNREPLTNIRRPPGIGTPQMLPTAAVIRRPRHPRTTPWPAREHRPKG
jgi:hypothetical protein